VKVAVIGSNCFTGSHVVDALLERADASVLGISRSPEKAAFFLPYKRHRGAAFSFHQVDIVREAPRLLALLDAERPDVVVNVAALSEVNLSNFHPVEYFDVNVGAVVRLLSELRSRPWLRRYVHISSAEIYGPCPRPLLETAPLDPSTPYAVSKAAADMFLLTLRKNFGVPITLVRSTNVFGRHQQLFKIIPRTAIYVRQGRKVELQGGGVAKKSFVHIRDVVRGVLSVIDAAAPEAIYHFSTDDDRTVRDVVELTCRLMGRDPADHTVIVGDRIGQDSRYLLDWSLARRSFGWRPEITLEAGIAETIAWVEAEWASIQREPLEYQHRV